MNMACPSTCHFNLLSSSLVGDKRQASLYSTLQRCLIQFSLAQFREPRHVGNLSVMLARACRLLIAHLGSLPVISYVSTNHRHTGTRRLQNI